MQLASHLKHSDRAYISQFSRINKHQANHEQIELEFSDQELISKNFRINFLCTSLVHQFNFYVLFEVPDIESKGIG